MLVRFAGCLCCWAYDGTLLMLRRDAAAAAAKERNKINEKYQKMGPVGDI